MAPNRPKSEAPKTPKAETLSVKLPDSPAEKAKSNEAELKAAIQKPAARKIEVLTGLKPTEMSDFEKFAAAVKGIIAFISGDKEGMEEVKNLFLKAGANKDELWGVMNDGRQEEFDPPPPPEEEDFSNPDGKEMSRAKKDPWNPEQIGLSREKAWGQRKVAEKAVRETEKQKLTPYLKEAEQKYGVPSSTILAIVAKESSMNPLAQHPKSKASGFAQAISSTAKEFLSYLKSQGEKIPPEGVFNPRIGILLTAWYIRKNIDTVSAAVKKRSATFSHNKKTFTIPVAESARFDASNVTAVYMCHNSGPSGYLAQCNMIEAQKSGDPEAISRANDALFGFQKIVKNGRPDWQNRAAYAKEVAAVAWNISELTKTEKQST